MIEKLENFTPEGLDWWEQKQLNKINEIIDVVNRSERAIGYITLLLGEVCKRGGIKITEEQQEILNQKIIQLVKVLKDEQ